jgi:hypothetical protein
VSSVLKKDGTTAAFSYDENGNLVSGDGRTVYFDALDRPVQVTMGTVTTTFAYSPEGERYLQRTTGSGVNAPRTVIYVGKEYEQVQSTGVEERSYVGDSTVIWKSSTSGRAVRYLHKDRLGSLEAVTDVLQNPSALGPLFDLPRAWGGGW